jgi:hypothetical protein
MRKIITGSILIFVVSLAVFSQSPQSFQYQSVVRDAGGNPVINQPVGFEINIQMGPPLGTIVYTETHQVTTNDYGIATLAIGAGTVTMGDFSTITWSTGNWFVMIGVDISGGTNYVNMGSTQLLSVPYAMYAQEAGNGFSGNYSDLTGPPTSLSQFTNDPGYITSPNDADADPANELQVLSVVNDTLYLSNGNFVPLTSFVDTLWQRNGNDIYNTNSRYVGVGLTDPNGKMVVKGDNTMHDSIPLFEVKDRTGHTVFVVYQDSVRIFVGDDGSKTNKGAFAVSGRNTAKQPTHEFFKVTPDSVRIFLDSASTMGGFAVKSFGNNLGKDFFSVYVDTAQTIDPSQKKILWYPAKSAFLSGQILIEDPDSVGTNSVAIGYENKAKGDWSQAMGYQCYARGNYSMAIGKNSQANANNSYAFGENVVAKAFDSYALGSKAQAEAIGSFAFGAAGRDTLGNLLGTYTKASGVGSYSFGAGCVASGINSVAFGVTDSATGKNSVAMGAYTKAYGDYSFAFGFPATGGWPVVMNPTTAGHYAVAIGNAVGASGFGSIAMGRYSYASGNNAIAIGYGVPNSFLAPANFNSAGGNNSLAVGYGNSAGGANSIAIGYDNSSVGDNAVTFGTTLTAPSFCQTSIGRWNLTIAGTATSWVLTDPLFVVGNGTASGARSNAMTILKNGNTGLGVTAPDATLDVVGTFQLGGGTSYKKFQAGTATIGSNAAGGVKVVTVTFPTAFPTVPKVVVTPKGVTGINDVFAFTTRDITVTGYTVVIYRIDAAGGTWGQNLLLDWYAWEQ